MKWRDKQIGIAILQERWWCKELLNFYVQRCPSGFIVQDVQKKNIVRPFRHILSCQANGMELSLNPVLPFVPILSFVSILSFVTFPVETFHETSLQQWVYETFLQQWIYETSLQQWGYKTSRQQQVYEKNVQTR
ncbi:MAG: hypothetical protein J6S82_03095 [Bacteroidales bacterium]|nr:hypothetical protein [Bacteroidales bacterium]